MIFSMPAVRYGGPGARSGVGVSEVVWVDGWGLSTAFLAVRREVVLDTITGMGQVVSLLYSSKVCTSLIGYEVIVTIVLPKCSLLSTRQSTLPILEEPHTGIRLHLSPVSTKLLGSAAGLLVSVKETDGQTLLFRIIVIPIWDHTSSPGLNLWAPLHKT